jgi:hypothetical protein
LNLGDLTPPARDAQVKLVELLEPLAVLDGTWLRAHPDQPDAIVLALQSLKSATRREELQSSCFGSHRFSERLESSKSAPWSPRLEADGFLGRVRFPASLAAASITPVAESFAGLAPSF